MKIEEFTSPEYVDIIECYNMVIWSGGFIMILNYDSNDIGLLRHLKFSILLYKKYILYIL